MQALLIYILKATIYSGILFGYYYIALRNKRFHYYNRFYLLMSVSLSLLLPFLHVELWQLQSSNEQVIQLMNVMATGAMEQSGNANRYRLSPDTFALLTYCFIAFCLVLSFGIGIIKIVRYKRQYPAEKLGSVLFINTDLPQAPFSFFNNLFWKNSINISDETGHRIFRHELTHIEQKHSWDKLFMQIITLLFWVNPFYWLTGKELTLIHEFIADETAIENKDTKAFALMLLQSQYSKAIFSPAQSFHYSPIKRRLLMLTTSKKPSFSYVRRIMILPLLTATILLFAFKLTKDDNNETVFHVNAPFTLVVDAGHGGNDDGAPGANDIVEKNINLTIAKKIQQLAPQYGITVAMTRTSDATVSFADRINVTKNQHPNAFVSVHVNNTPGKQTDKNEVSVYIQNEETNSNYKQSRLLGSGLVQMVKHDFPVNDTLMQRRKNHIYVLDQNPCPAVLIECGYMNNIESVKQLTDDVKIEQMARDILQGVVAYENADKSTVINTTDTTGKVPLYMLDGKEILADEMNKINAGNIESISVLKDKTVIQQYGEKGKYGVVLIKLKTKSDGIAKPVHITMDKSTFDTTKTPLYIVDGKEISKTDLNTVSVDDIENINVVKGDEAIKEYGEKGKNGVVKIKMKTNSSKKDSSSTGNFKRASPESE